MKFGSPRVLTSRIALPSGLVGNIPFDSGLLQAPDREAFAVHEIRFTADLGDTAYQGQALYQPESFFPSNYQPNDNTDAGPFVRVEMRVGPYRICEHVPMWALAASRDFCLEGANWRLPLTKPLFIPPGMGFFATAQRPGMTVAGVLSEPWPFVNHTVFVTCSLVGRVVTGGFPRTAVVPYIDAYAPAAAVQGAAFMSPQDTLKNKLSAPLPLLYGLGRVAHLRVAPPVALPNLLSFSCADAHLTMRCSLSDNYTPIVVADSEFDVAFDPCTRVLNLAGVTLPPGGRLVFKSEAPVYTGAEVAQAWAPVVSIVGERREAV